MKEVQVSPSKALDIDIVGENKGSQLKLRTGRINEALGTPVDESSGSDQVLRSDSFSETIALEVNENNNQKLFNQAKDNSSTKQAPRFDK